MSFLNGLPNVQELSEKDISEKYGMLKANCHLHTPYSFSAFEDIPQIFRMAKEEGINVLGINDFYTASGYKEFAEHALRNRVFPLFNIEFMGLIKKYQQQNIRVNDPSNPGRIYFCGKGLDFPVTMPPENQAVIERLIAQSTQQTSAMLERVNQLLNTVNAGWQLDKDTVLKEYTKGMLRERHIAKALRIKIQEEYPGTDQQKSFLQALYQGKPPTAPLNDIPALENELRKNLLKAGGAAYVPEDETAFLPLEQIIEWIIAAGGIPCYPVLLDDKNGDYTDFEKDFEKMHRFLVSKNIYFLELIPGRNDLSAVKAFIRFFRERNFRISFGTEHNTPALTPLDIICRGNVPLDEELHTINYHSACIIAAHQYLRAKGEQGFIKNNKEPDIDHHEKYIKLGKAVIQEYFKQ